MNLLSKNITQLDLENKPQQIIPSEILTKLRYFLKNIKKTELIRIKKVSISNIFDDHHGLKP